MRKYGTHLQYVQDRIMAQYYVRPILCIQTITVGETIVFLNLKMCKKAIFYFMD